MKTNYLRIGSAWLLVALFLFVGAPHARAEIELIPDKLSMVGYLRHQTVLNMGTISPFNESWGQSHKNRYNLSRTWLVTEFDYTPNDTFRLHSQVRAIWDSTQNLDSRLLSYDAFPSYEVYEHSDLRATGDDQVNVQMWEIYGDLYLGNLWLRLGKQQIAWGEMISIRVLDMINPLDRSWHFQWEPEEFENIRIPQWMIRGMYTIEQSVVPWLQELYIEGFLNPGDVFGTVDPPVGNPYRLTGVSGGPPAVFTFKDRKGNDEFGFRLGYKVWDIAGTLNYAYLYTDGAYYQDVSPPGPPPFQIKVSYPQIDVYGASLNYAFEEGTVVSIEAKYIPDMPYYEAEPMGTLPPPNPNIYETDYCKWAINFQRFTRVLRTEPFMNIQLQYSQEVVSHHDDVKLTPAPYSYSNDTESVVDTFALILNQDFRYKTYKASCVILYQPEGAYRINPGFRYSPGDNWVFDVYANWWGGSAGRHEWDNKQFLTYFNYLDEVMARITYQF